MKNEKFKEKSIKIKATRSNKLKKLMKEKWGRLNFSYFQILSIILLN